MTTKYSKRRQQLAFSLVEVVIALAVIAFACVTLLGLLANGLVTVKNSVNNTVNAEIIQSVINNSQVNSYANNVTNYSYYDNQGNLLTNVTTALTGNTIGAVYFANVAAVPLLTTNYPAGVNNNYTYNGTNSACLLQVSVTNIAAPGAANVFSLIWANSGK